MTDSNTLPAPLVPAYVDLTKYHDMPLDVQRLREARMFASVPPEAAVVNIILWCASWHQVPAGSLPDDDVDLANLAGFGRFMVEKWREVRAAGALYGFVKCADGRLYHRVVAEVALVAWRRKREYEYGKFKEAVRKHNHKLADGHPEMRVLPPFEEWDAADMAKVSAGMAAPSAGKPAISAGSSPTPVRHAPPPNPEPSNSAGNEGVSASLPPENTPNPAEFPTNRTEHNGTEQNGTEQHPLGRPPLQPIPPEGSPVARGEMALALRKRGVQVASHNPTLHEWLRDGFTTEQLVEAVEIARVQKPAPEPIPAGYLDKVLRSQAQRRATTTRPIARSGVTQAEHDAVHAAIFGDQDHEAG